MIGADNLQNIHRWRDAPRLLSEYGVVVYPRTGFEMARTRQLLLEECRQFPAPYVLDSWTSPDTASLESLDRLYNISLIDAPIIDISSTEIREREALGEDMSEFLM